MQNDSFCFLFVIGILGLFIGSFLNMLIYRLPIMLKNTWKSEYSLYGKSQSSNGVFNLFRPRSHCPKCNNLIAFWQNIPIVSFIFLKGKCASCKEKISLRYPSVELISCLASLLIAYKYSANPQTVALLFLTWVLIAIISIDIEQLLLPDGLTIPFIWIGLLLNTQNFFITSRDAIIGCALGYLSLWIVAYIFKIIRKTEGMGHGDFKLLALFGAWFGWQVLPFIILFASLTGSIAGTLLIICKKHSYNKPIPFGPFLAATGWISIFFQHANMLSYLMH